MVLIYKKVFLHEKIKRLTSAQYNFLVEGFSSGIALQALVEELGFSTMVSAQLSFATAHGDLVGTLQAISEHFSNGKISATVL